MCEIERSCEDCVKDFYLILTRAELRVDSAHKLTDFTCTYRDWRTNYSTFLLPDFLPTLLPSQSHIFLPYQLSSIVVPRPNKPFCHASILNWVSWRTLWPNKLSLLWASPHFCTFFHFSFQSVEQCSAKFWMEVAKNSFCVCDTANTEMIFVRKM